MYQRAIGLLFCFGLALPAAAGSAPAPRPLPGASVTAFFPGPYFADKGQEQLRQIVLAYWPGPTQLLARWRAGGLGAEQRVLLLLGAGCFNDRALLPVYREALGDRDPRVRSAAVAGYRELIGDLPAVVREPPSDADVRSLRSELDAMAAALRVRPLVALWVDALAHAENQALPGRAPIVLKRPADYCLKVIDRLVTPHDLPLLAAVYPLLDGASAKLGLVKLIQGLALRKFIVRPRGRTGWGSGVWELALESCGNFLYGFCPPDPARVVRAGLRTTGLAAGDPFGASSCAAWIAIAKENEPTWWGTAAQQLYLCGGPPLEISRLRAGQPDVAKAHGVLMNYYRGF